MRSCKLFGLALTAALLASALIGAGSASAVSALCSAAPENKGGDLVCQAGTLFEEATVFGENEKNVLFSTAIGNVECTKASFTSLLVQIGKKATGPTGFSYGGTCTSTITGCGKVLSVTSVGGIESEAEYLQKAAPEGVLVLVEPSTMLELECGILTVQCVYGGNTGETASGNIHNGEQKLKFVAGMKRVGKSTACPDKATMIVNYNIKRLRGKIGKAEVGEGVVHVAKE